MAIMLNREEDKNEELTRRINADLRSRTMQNELIDNVDLVDDSEYVKDMKNTSSLAWIWAVVGVIVVVALIVFGVTGGA